MREAEKEWADNSWLPELLRRKDEQPVDHPVPEIAPTIVLPLGGYPLIGQGPSTAAAGLAVALGNYPRGAVDRGRASAYRRRGRSLETVAPRMLRWSSFRMRQQEMMQDMK